MELVFLGTSAGAPTVHRNVQSVVLKLENGKSLLFDAGEGTQQQLLRYNAKEHCSKIKVSSIRTIFLTHLHGDHLFGLPGLLCLLDAGGSPLRVVAPQGLCEYVVMSLRVSRTELRHNLTLIELLNFDEKESTFTVPENVSYIGMRPQEDEIWYELCDEIQVSAARIDHAGVPCLAYAITEPPRPGKLDAGAVRTIASETKDDPKRIFRLLSRKDCASIRFADGSQMDDLSHFYLGRKQQLPGRKIALFGDNRPSNLNQTAIAMCQGADVLVHEATLENALKDLAFERGHSTPGDAGALARSLKATTLVLWHFSPRYKSHEDEAWQRSYLQEARLANTSENDEADNFFYTGQIYLAYDFFSLPIPRK